MNRIDTTGQYTGLGEKATFALSRLSARALEGRALAGVDELHLEDCTNALEALAWPAPDSLQKVALWLGSDYSTARRRAQRLREVLEACATVAICADPAQTGAFVGALQRFAYHLAEMVEGRSGAEPPRSDSREGLVQHLQRRIGSAVDGKGFGVALVHCAAVDQIDALRGLRAGDIVVQTITNMLRHQVLRPSDTVEPTSRDEFACLFHPMPSEGVAILAAQKILRVLESPIEFGEFAVAPEPHIGLALWPEHGKDAEQLLQHAKAALRIARSGHERIALYRADSLGTDFDESRYAARLRHAIANNSGLTLFYQPQADFRTGRVIGAEALLRWNDEELGPVAPNVAVAVAESTGMMNDLTLWVINSAIQQCASFRKVQSDFTVSVNISPSNLHEADLPAYVERALRTWNVSSRGLVFEVTETAILSDQKVAMEALNQLKRLGVSIAIDDFGTGYSSMYYLAQMPLDELKIDIMFVRQMLQLPQHAKIVRSLIDLAHNLELSVVAEGVEDEPIWSTLQHLGCERGQGWFIGKPMPASDLERRIEGADINVTTGVAAPKTIAATPARRRHRPKAT
ncbi:MAG: putative bifunctional diguanylate cyclase/phosphodiesterase [Burkholderiales bacterium]